RERDKGPALMADRAEISVEDEMQRLLAAVVGMHAPADVRQQAGGMPQAAVFVGLPQFHGTDQAVGPADQLFCMPRGPRQQLLRLCAAQIRPSSARLACGSIS